MTEPQKMKVFVIAGEASGDLHGSHVVRKLVAGDGGIAACEVVCWGGDLMAQAGGRLLSHYKDRASMGLGGDSEFAKNLRFFGSGQGRYLGGEARFVVADRQSRFQFADCRMGESAGHKGALLHRTEGLGLEYR